MIARWRSSRIVDVLVGAMLSLLVLALLGVQHALAQSSSTNYQVNEYFFGTGGELDPSSPNYKAKQTTGETAIGNQSSTSYQAQGGFNTTDTPYLEFVVNSGSIDLGNLSTSSTATTTATFYVRAYLSSGYQVTAESAPPKNGGYTINALSSPTASATGSEQFGINLVANTSPTSFGANPSQNPDSSFSFGAAATGYDTANQYKYVQGDAVALSTKSSGRTDYTISYIFNISSTTPGGQYSFSQNLVATATY